MSVRWLLIASIVLIALSAFYAGVNASDFAQGHQGHFIVGVLVCLAGLLAAIGRIWNTYPH
jgi:hypothetical protein